MTRSPVEPRPVPVRRYRYSKLRWRVLVHALDGVGSMAMTAFRRVRPAAVVEDPRRILIAQLDHLGDAVLTSPMLPRLREAYPNATIDVLASASNRAIFEADPHVNRVILAERNWFERRPATWAMGSAVWSLGRSLRKNGYDLGIDVRGDVLTVIVLALAGIPRRVGWAMGGGGFLLTDVAEWLPGRHEVRSRMALLSTLGIDDFEPARVSVGVSDDDRAEIGRRLRESWPGRLGKTSRVRSGQAVRAAHRPHSGRTSAFRSRAGTLPHSDDAETLHAGRFGVDAPLLAVHLGAGTAAKRWPLPHWNALLKQFLADGWRVVIVGSSDDAVPPGQMVTDPNLCDWTGRLAVTQTAAVLERADLFIGADSGPAHLASCSGVPSVILFSGTNRARQWRPWSRRSLVLKHAVGCRPCHHKTCPLADHPCMAGLRPERVYRAARKWWARLHREQAPHSPI